MDKYYIKFNDDDNKYIQLSKHIKRLIDEGELLDGEKLPSIRVLSETLKVNKITVKSAYDKLFHEGYVSHKIGSGTFARKKEVTRNLRKEYLGVSSQLSSGGMKEYIDFTGETISPDFFPVKELKEVLNDVLENDGVDAFLYQDPLGYSKLREAINNKFWNGQRDIDEMLIVSGAQQGIDIASKALINVNDTIVVEKPTYNGALSVFKWRKANIIEIPIIEDGIDLSAFKMVLKKNNIKCLYMMSYFQNPTGITYSQKNKEELIELAEEYDFYIIEDDFLSELIYEEDINYVPIKKMDKYNRVIYIKSFSKVFLPGIRLGYVIVPPILKDAIQNSKINTDIATSSLMQRALERYINSDMWKKHIENLNIAYCQRYNYLKNQLIDKLGVYVDFIDPKGGLHFLLKIKTDIRSSELFTRLKEKQLLITPGAVIFKNSREGEQYFRIGFSQCEYDSIDKGIDLIVEVFQELTIKC